MEKHFNTFKEKARIELLFTELKTDTGINSCTHPIKIEDVCMLCGE